MIYSYIANSVGAESLIPAPFFLGLVGFLRKVLQAKTEPYLIFFLPKVNNPMRPVPNNNIDVGSGIGFESK